jgi:hypothetical protein
MDLRAYFEQKQGLGVLSTADAQGAVNAAIYARPHCFDDGSLGFIMPDRLTHQNLKANPRAVYLFREDAGDGEARFAGTRLYLKMIAEDSDPERIARLRRRAYGDDRDGRFLVLFQVEKILPLVGGGDVPDA